MGRKDLERPFQYKRKEGALSVTGSTGWATSWLVKEGWEGPLGPHSISGPRDQSLNS